MAAAHYFSKATGASSGRDISASSASGARTGSAFTSMTKRTGDARILALENLRGLPTAGPRRSRRNSFLQRSDFTRHLGHDGIALEFAWDGSLVLGRLAREHDLETLRVSVFTQADVNTHDAWNRQQFTVVRGQHGVDVPPGRGGIF